MALGTLIRFQQHGVLMALPSVCAVHLLLPHSFLQDACGDLINKGPSRYRPEVDLRLNAKIIPDSNHRKMYLKDELTLFSKAVCHGIQPTVESKFDPFCGVRIGEATNPGPDKKKAAVRMAICNPHAILSHKKELLGLESDIVFVSETSATKASQTEFQHNIFQDGFRCFWSPPVESKYQTDQNEFCLRGEPLGAAVVTSMNSRISRCQIPQDLWATNRIATSIIQINGIDTLCVAVYGYAKKCQDGKRLNDLFVARLFNLVSDANMPYIIGGDFNDQPTSLPSFQAFEETGAFEAHTFCETCLGYKLPPTCRGATFNDTVIFHPCFKSHIDAMTVCHDKQMDSHSPLIVTFDFWEKTP